MKNHLRQRGIRLLLATTALLALAAGMAYAAIPDSNGVVQACYQKVNGQLRVIDTSKGGNCNASENALSWNQTGPPGAKGTTGAKGPTGRQGRDRPARRQRNERCQGRNGTTRACRRAGQRPSRVGQHRGNRRLRHTVRQLSGGDDPDRRRSPDPRARRRRRRFRPADHRRQPVQQEPVIASAVAPASWETQGLNNNWFLLGYALCASG